MKDESILNHDEALFQNALQNEASFNIKPSKSFSIMAWLVLVTGFVTFNIGLLNSGLELSEKGYYFIVMLYGLFSALTVQKSTRDKHEKLPVSDLYLGISWAATIVAVILLVVGLTIADLELSEKGFFGMDFIVSMFAIIVVQKNVRDTQMSIVK